MLIISHKVFQNLTGTFCTFNKRILYKFLIQYLCISFRKWVTHQFHLGYILSPSKWFHKYPIACSSIISLQHALSILSINSSTLLWSLVKKWKTCNKDFSSIFFALILWLLRVSNVQSITIFPSENFLINSRLQFQIPLAPKSVVNFSKIYILRTLLLYSQKGHIFSNLLNKIRIIIL